jgi:hypothetical protein
MSEKIISKAVGELKQYKDIEEWLESEKVAIPFFDTLPLKFIFTENDDQFFIESDIAVSNFLSLTNDDRLKISDLVHKNCRDFLDVVEHFETDKPMLEIVDSQEIWKYVRPSKIYVSRRDYGDKDVYIQVSCGCDWEEEHGLQLVFRQGKKITRVSDCDGHLTEADAFGKPDEEDKLLSEFEY